MAFRIALMFLQSLMCFIIYVWFASVFLYFITLQIVRRAVSVCSKAVRDSGSAKEEIALRAEG